MVRTQRTFWRRVGATTAAAGCLMLLSPGIGRADMPQGDLRIELVEVATGLISPLYLTHAGDGSGRLFVVDQAGPIWIVKNGVLLPTPFLDLTSEIPMLAAGFDERGVLGMAFHPDYENNGRFFVRYSRPRVGMAGEPCFGTSRGCHEEVLAEFTVSADPDIANTNGTILFRVDEPEFNHNSGGVAFGPDGYLYFTLGDGGGANDGLSSPSLPHGPIGNGQNINTPLGSMIRIDVDSGFPYAIPPDNPFVGTDGLDEIYAYGFRNPFSFSFDDGPGGDGTLYVADVGQALFEELNIVEKGGNYGWVIREGAHCFDPFNPGVPPPSCDSNGLIDPIAEYIHEDGGLSIITASVYRGSQFPCLVGTLILGDFSRNFGPTGSIYYLDQPSPGEYQILEVKLGYDNRRLGKALKGFGEDEAGELYVLASANVGPTGTAGVVYRLEQVLEADADGDCDVDLVDFVGFADCLTGPGGSFTQTHSVQVSSDFFSPSNLVIGEGDTVEWMFVRGIHNVESGTGGVHDGNFNSGTPGSVTSFDVTFDSAYLAAHPEPGNVYPYYCELHEFFGMTGTVTVQGSACAEFDADGDGDVDLEDYRIFQLSFTGAP